MGLRRHHKSWIQYLAQTRMQHGAENKVTYLVYVCGLISTSSLQLLGSIFLGRLTLGLAAQERVLAAREGTAMPRETRTRRRNAGSASCAADSSSLRMRIHRLISIAAWQL